MFTDFPATFDHKIEADEVKSASHAAFIDFTHIAIGRQPKAFGASSL
jgi:hypothetical protein